MFAKFGFILVVVVFGALMFVAGAIAPESIRQPLDAFGKRAAARFGAAAANANTSAASAPAIPASLAGTMAATPPAPEAPKPDPVWAESLLLPTPLPEKGQYALQAGQFASADEANALGARIKALHLPFVKVLDVVDQAGVHSSVVPVGPYASPDEARAARSSVARDLGLTGPLTLILLPSSGAAAASQAPAAATASASSAPAASVK